MTNTTFKAGDKVYFPREDGKIYMLDSRESTNYPLFIDELTTSFTVDGKFSTSDQNPLIFHVTNENCESLSKLYNTQFEKPKKLLKGSDLARHLLSEGKWLICYLDYRSDKCAIKDLCIGLIIGIDDNDNFIEYDGTTWNYAVPLHVIEPTDKPLEMEI